MKSNNHKPIILPVQETYDLIPHSYKLIKSGEDIKNSLSMIENLPVETQICIKVGKDWTNDDAVWIIVGLRNRKSDWAREKIKELRKRIEENIEELVKERELIAYINFTDVKK
jgi:hypothetical protein